jgi:hypothetical protein
MKWSTVPAWISSVAALVATLVQLILAIRGVP